MNRGVAGEWVLTILLSIIAPIVVYSVATDHGVADVPALLLSGVPPLIELVVVFAIRRRVEEIGVIALLFVVVSLVVALATGDARALLLRESLVIGLFGLVGMGGVAAAPIIGRIVDRLVPWVGAIIATLASLGFYSVQLGAGGVNIAMGSASLPCGVVPLVSESDDLTFLNGRLNDTVVPTPGSLSSQICPCMTFSRIALQIDRPRPVPP